MRMHTTYGEGAKISYPHRWQRECHPLGCGSATPGTDDRSGLDERRTVLRSMPRNTRSESLTRIRLPHGKARDFSSRAQDVPSQFNLLIGKKLAPKHYFVDM